MLQRCHPAKKLRMVSAGQIQKSSIIAYEGEAHCFQTKRQLPSVGRNPASITQQDIYNYCIHLRRFRSLASLGEL